MITLTDLAEGPALTTGQKLKALAGAVHEMGVVLALTRTHGARAFQVYIDRGGSIRFDGDGAVLIYQPPTQETPNDHHAHAHAR